MNTQLKSLARIFLSACLFLSAGLSTYAQHDHPAAQTQATVYACPMHPEVTSDKPGTCSKCGMALVAKPAQKGDHQHGSPHGGQVVTAGNHHVEMVMKGDAVHFYLLDGQEKTEPNKNVTGVAMFQFADGKTANIEMKASGDDHFEVVPTNAGDFTVIVTFNKGTEKISARLTSGTRGAMPVKKPAHSDGHDHQH